MCWCTPTLRTACCGRRDCRPPCSCGAPLAARDVRLAHAADCMRWPAAATPAPTPAPAPSVLADPPAEVLEPPTADTVAYQLADPPAPAALPPAPPVRERPAEPPPAARPNRPLQDGAAMLSKLTGIPRPELLEIWDSVKANHARIAACPRHSFDTPLDQPNARIRARWECSACLGVVSESDKRWYEAGLKHGGGA